MKRKVMAAFIITATAASSANELAKLSFTTANDTGKAETAIQSAPSPAKTEYAEKSEQAKTIAERIFAESGGNTQWEVLSRKEMEETFGARHEPGGGGGGAFVAMTPPNFSWSVFGRETAQSMAIGAGSTQILHYAVHQQVADLNTTLLGAATGGVFGLNSAIARGAHAFDKVPAYFRTRDFALQQGATFPWVASRPQTAAPDPYGDRNRLQHELMHSVTPSRPHVFGSSYRTRQFENYSGHASWYDAYRD